MAHLHSFFPIARFRTIALILSVAVCCSALSACVTDPYTGERRITWQRPTGLPPTVAEVTPPTARVFLTDGLFTEAAVACGKPAVIDAIIDGSAEVLAEPFRRDALKMPVRHLDKYKHLVAK